MREADATLEEELAKLVRYYISISQNVFINQF